MALSNVTIVKMFFLNVNFTKFIVELHVFLITSIPINFQNDEKSTAIQSTKCSKFKS